MTSVLVIFISFFSIDSKIENISSKTDKFYLETVCMKTGSKISKCKSIVSQINGGFCSSLRYGDGSFYEKVNESNDMENYIVTKYKGKFKYKCKMKNKMAIIEGPFL